MPTQGHKPFLCLGEAHGKSGANPSSGTAAKPAKQWGTTPFHKYQAPLVGLHAILTVQARLASSFRVSRVSWVNVLNTTLVLLSWALGKYCLHMCSEMRKTSMVALVKSILQTELLIYIAKSLMSFQPRS